VNQAGHIWKTVTIAVCRTAPHSATSALHGATAFFGPNSAALTSAMQSSLATVLPQLRKASIVVVLGYAANDGTGTPLSAFSLTLSQQRAAAVTAYLTAHGVHVSSSTRYGKTQQTKGGTAANRRADIDWTS
jgi:outer membrane protein OmpA-like peptidoglycan-associated protein